MVGLQIFTQNRLIHQSEKTAKQIFYTFCGEKSTSCRPVQILYVTLFWLYLKYKIKSICLCWTHNPSWMNTSYYLIIVYQLKLFPDIQYSVWRSVRFDAGKAHPSIQSIRPVTIERWDDRKTEGRRRVWHRQNTQRGQGLQTLWNVYWVKRAFASKLQPTHKDRQREYIVCLR